MNFTKNTCLLLLFTVASFNINAMRQNPHPLFSYNNPDTGYASSDEEHFVIGGYGKDTRNNKFGPGSKRHGQQTPKKSPPRREKKNKNS